MFENVDGRRTDRRADAGRTDAGVIGILLAQPWALGSGELKSLQEYHKSVNQFRWA